MMHNHRRRRAARFLLALPGLLALTVVGCLTTNQSAGPPHVKLDFEQYKLTNGLQVIVRKDSRLPVVAVNLWYHVGPAKETAGKTGLAQEAVFHQLFPQDHPYYADVIGSHADVQAAKLEDVRDFFKSYYAPNNATLAIIGDIDVEKTKAMVEKYFGTIARGPDVPPV